MKLLDLLIESILLEYDSENVYDFRSSSIDFEGDSVYKFRTPDLTYLVVLKFMKVEKILDISFFTSEKLLEPTDKGYSEMLKVMGTVIKIVKTHIKDALKENFVINRLSFYGYSKRKELGRHEELNQRNKLYTALIKRELPNSKIELGGVNRIFVDIDPTEL